MSPSARAHLFRTNFLQFFSQIFCQISSFYITKTIQLSIFLYFILQILYLDTTIHQLLHFLPFIRRSSWSFPNYLSMYLVIFILSCWFILSYLKYMSLNIYLGWYIKKMILKHDNMIKTIKMIQMINMQCWWRWTKSR